MGNLNILTSEEAAYIAGMWDGEGNIRIQKRKTKYDTLTFVLQLSVTNNNLEVLEYIKEKIGRGGVHIHTPPSKNHRGTFRYSISATLAYELLPQLIPYLIIKKKHAEICLRYADYMNGRRQRKGRRTEEETELCVILWKKLRDLNKRVGHQKL